MLTKQILRQLFARTAGVPFEVNYWDHTSERFGQGAPKFTIFINDDKISDLLKEDMEMAFGEAYVAGKWDVAGDLADVVVLAAQALNKHQATLGAELMQKAGKVAWRMMRRSRRQQKEDVQHHYDLGNDFFRLWLDTSQCYSCAYFHSPDDSLEDAQRQKIDHSLRKLRLTPGETLLDIGSGWGALLLRAAEAYGVRVLGITLSEEQYSYSCHSIHSLSLEERADVRLVDYRTLAKEGRQFDKIVSIGMIEHVGKAHLAEFAEAVSALLRPGGLALLHCITSPQEGPFNAWMDKHIFPGAYLPTLPEMLDHLSSQDLRVLDVESLRPHYRLTLDHCSERFERHADEIREMFGEAFVRMWRLYLRGSSASFRVGTSEVHQMLVSKGKTEAVPLTRDDLYR